MSEVSQPDGSGAGEGHAAPSSCPAENAPEVPKEEVKVVESAVESAFATAKVELDQPSQEAQANGQEQAGPSNSVVTPEVPKQEVKVVESATAVAPATVEPDQPLQEAQLNGQEQAGPSNSVTSEDWQLREQELLDKIEKLEQVKRERGEDGIKFELKVREEQIDLLKARIKNLETKLEAAMSKPGQGKNQEMIDSIKVQHDELLTKARGMIFDKTKMVKNQELQIEALTTQVQSLKDINLITKDLLEIRNSEVKAMQDRLDTMEARIKGEKEKYSLMLKKAQNSTTLNDDLKKEYETQLTIFKELRQKYEQRVQALVVENNKLKESLKGGASG